MKNLSKMMLLLAAVGSMTALAEGPVGPPPSGPATTSHPKGSGVKKEKPVVADTAKADEKTDGKAAEKPVEKPALKKK
jgi:hypothetical protein